MEIKIDIPIVVSLSQMKKHWWTTFYWEEITAYGDSERQFIRSVIRSPDEMLDAEAQWELFEKECFRENNLHGNCMAIG